MTKTKDTEKKSTEIPAAPKHGKARLIVGITLIVLVVIFALLSTIVMRQRIEAADEAAKPLLRRGLQNDLIVFIGLLIVVVGFTFDILTGSRFRAVRLVGYAVFGIGILVTAEALFMSGRIAIRDKVRTASPKAPYVLVLGTDLIGEKNEAPLDLNARLDTALDWWKEHSDVKVIVAGTGTVAKASTRKYTTPGYTSSNKGKSAVDSIGSYMTQRITAVLTAREDAESAEAGPQEGQKKETADQRKERIKAEAEAMIIKLGESGDAESAFRNLLGLEGIDTDTPIVLITNDYDMEEAIRTAEELGFTDVTRLPAPSDFWMYGTNVLWNVWREYDPALRPVEDAA